MAFTQISTDGIKNGTITGSDLATNIDLVDNQKLRLGTGNDLEIYHDNSSSRIIAANHDLIVQSNGYAIRNENGSSTFATIDSSGTVGITGTNLNMNSAYIDFSGSISTPSTAAAIYRPADNTLAFSTANTERVRITNGGLDPSTDAVTDLGNSGNRFRHLNLSGRVLIGGATTSQGSTNADDLQVGASGQSNQTGITLGSAVASSLRFMDAANDSAGYIFYNHGTDDMTIAATNSVTLSEAGTVRFSTHSNGVIISGFTDVRQDSTSAYSASAAPGNLLARFYNGSAQSNSMASIQLRAANDNGAADLWYMTCVAQAQNYNGFLAFSTRTSASVYQEVARMTNGRSFLVGTTAHLNLGANNVTGIVLEHNGRITACRNGSAALHVGRQGDNGEAVLFACQGTSIVGSINVTTTSATLQSGSSDRTMKKNFEDWTEDTLSLFKNIKPQKFNFIIEDDGAEKTKGYIAQDLVDSFPEAYPKNSEGKYMFSPQGMVVYLMKAIQELEAEVAALKAA